MAGVPAALPDLAALIREHKARVRDHPKDARSWAVLGTAYVERGRRTAVAADFPKAERALLTSLEVSKTEGTEGVKGRKGAQGFRGGVVGGDRREGTPRRTTVWPRWRSRGGTSGRRGGGARRPYGWRPSGGPRTRR